jgi:hypothetical protein
MSKPLGDSTTIPQSFADLTGTVQGAQLPGGAPTGSGPVVMANAPVLAGCTNTGQESVKRIDAHQGAAVVSGDFVLSAGWGTSPTFTVVRGTDQGAVFTITAKATVGANPTVTFTFHNGAWPNGAPVVVCNRTEIVAATGSPAAAVSNEFVPTTVSTTQIVFTFNGTPVANSTYGCSFICMGT